ncbi:MAG TPA: hypothetical protein PLA24_02240 [Tenuifilaceae bacterium]|nr:hypothetical protein [Tenuifilaceae bacterium]
MKKQFLFLLLIGVLSLLFFFGTFGLLQNGKIYRNTLGVVSQNYEHTGGWSDFNISKVSKPYLPIEDSSYLNWDAAIYNCISQNLYTNEEACYGKVRPAFFPLFPLLWKVTQASPLVISILNYLMFIISIAILVTYLLPGNKRLVITTFIILITLPTSVIYLIPYSESLFLLCAAVAVVGMLRDRYSLYFIGFLLMSMVRPATIFVLLAIVVTEVFIFIRNKGNYRIIRHSLLKLLPFLIGYLTVWIIQYLSSGSWTAFVDAQEHWAGKIQWIHEISDWSVEGFGMNTFAIFFVAIPALAYLFYIGFTMYSKKQLLFNIDEKSKRGYLLLISLFYLVGIFVFTLLTSGGSLHSFFRFTICSPFFYIAALIAISNFPKLSIKFETKMFGVSFLLLCLFVFVVGYGGSRFQFSFFGLFMLIVTSFYLLTRRFLSVRSDTILLFLIVVFNTIWNTYMLNIFFSNGWIFT